MGGVLKEFAELALCNAVRLQSNLGKALTNILALMDVINAILTIRC